MLLKDADFMTLFPKPRRKSELTMPRPDEFLHPQIGEVAKTLSEEVLGRGCADLIVVNVDSRKVRVVFHAIKATDADHIFQQRPQCFVLWRSDRSENNAPWSDALDLQKGISGWKDAQIPPGDCV